MFLVLYPLPIHSESASYSCSNQGTDASNAIAAAAQIDWSRLELLNISDMLLSSPYDVTAGDRIIYDVSVDIHKLMSHAMSIEHHR